MMIMGGHVAGSINIPLNEIPHRMQEIQELKAPLVLCLPLEIEVDRHKFSDLARNRML
jgi:hypothetical protein